MKRKSIIIITISTLGIIFVVLGIILLTQNNILERKSKLTIIDATYSCTPATEVFYEDDKYIYAFPCVKSNSVYVKLDQKNKILVTKALELKKVTIDELIHAGLEVYKQEK